MGRNKGDSKQSRRVMVVCMAEGHAEMTMCPRIRFVMWRTDRVPSRSTGAASVVLLRPIHCSIEFNMRIFNPVGIEPNAMRRNDKSISEGILSDYIID